MIIVLAGIAQKERAGPRWEANMETGASAIRDHLWQSQTTADSPGRQTTTNPYTTMKRCTFFLIASILLATALDGLAQSYVLLPSTGQRLYSWDGEHLMQSSTGKRLYKWDGTHILKADTGQRLYKWDGQYLLQASTGKRLYRLDGTNVLQADNGKRLFQYDTRYLTRASSGERVLEVKGILPVAILMALATGLL